jgi:hypothetical protein
MMHLSKCESWEQTLSLPRHPAVHAPHGRTLFAHFSNLRPNHAFMLFGMVRTPTFGIDVRCAHIDKYIKINLL